MIHPHRPARLAALMLSTALLTTGCQVFEQTSKNVENTFTGLSATITTFDADSRPLDEITGRSVSIETDDRFDITDSSGAISKESSVLSITTGQNHISHVGSTLIMSETGLDSVLDDPEARALVRNETSASPVLVRLKEGFANAFTGKPKTILIRSQQGVPLAVYTGQEVSTFSARGIPNSTVLLVDGKALFIYRAEFTIYDTALLED